jgi:hypothetical protein
MARDDRCLETLRKAGFNPDEAEDHLASVQRYMADYKAKGLSDEQAIAQGIKDTLAEQSSIAQRQRLNALMNLQKRGNLWDRVSGFLDDVKKGEHPTATDMFNSIRSVLVGGYEKVKNAKLSLESDVQDIWRKNLGGFSKAMEESKLFKVAQDGTYDKDIAKEISKPGSTGNKQAEALAKIFRNYVELAKNGVNNEGAWIGDLKDFILRNEHDWEKISKSGYDGWKADIFKTINEDKTFAGMDKPRIEQFLKNTYNALVSGEFFVGGKVGMKDPAFTGPGNVAKKLSKERVLHFNDDGWYDYQQKYGSSSTLMQSVMNTIVRGAKDEGLMRWFGTNPEAEFQNLLTRMQQTFSKDVPEEVRKFQQEQTEGGTLPNYKQRLQNRFNEVSGRGDMPANKLATKIGVALRTYQVISKLGMVPFAHANVPVTRGLAAHSFGDSAFSQLGDSIKALFDRGKAGDPETKQILDLIGARNSGFISHIMSNFHEGITGKSAAISNLMMKMTGIHYVINSNRTSSEFGLSHFLGSNLEKDFDKLPDLTGKELQTYGIMKEDWESLRNAEDPHMLEGGKYLTPDLARRTDLTPAKQADLERRLSMMFADYSRRALNIPGAETRSLLFRDLPFRGPLSKSLVQFKQWPVELMINAYGRTVFDNPTTKQKMMGAFALGAGLTSAGYIRIALSAASKGNPIPDPSDYRTILESAQAGGAATVMADTFSSLFRQHDYGKAVAGLFGPTASDLYGLGEIGFNAAQGKKNQVGALETYGLKHIPLENLWYTQLLTNYLFMWNLHEQVQPGWSERYENYIQQDTGSKPFLGPTQRMGQ